MKKIGLVTYYKSYNYGVWLQAYATVKFLQLQGYEAEIIPYSNKFEENKLKYFYKEGGRITGYLTSLLKTLLFGKVKYYNKGFKSNINKYYGLSKKEYHSLDELKNLEYDIIAVGSDQVWNPKITNGLEKVFLLEFGKAHKKISIASSLGSEELCKSDKELLINSLKKFDAISVRENFAKEYLQKEINKNIKVISDPTFLLTGNEWVDLIGRDSIYYNKNDKYILTYFVSKDKNSNECVELVKGYSQKYSLPIWSVQFSSYYSKGVDKKILGASIGDFIALLKNAEMVITDSFHGTALSLNLNKNFISCINSENPIRTYSLLEKVGLINRINMKPSDYEAVRYDVVNKIINNMRDESQNWVINVIESDDCISCKN